MQKIMFAQFVKVNEATGEFTGIAAEEIPDQAGEIFDYEASKPLIKAWSDDSFEHSGGKSRGNLRAMHDPKRAAGLLTAINFNDELKRVEVSGQVVDTEELAKLTKGVYTGLSFGGSYAWRKQEGIHVRYAAKPVELSLADKPCVPTARFTLVKADGSEVETAFGGTGILPVQKVAERKDTDPKEGEKKYGDVKFADAKNKKYPIDTVEHIRAAWNYINKAKNAAKYDAGDLKSIKGKIIAAWKEKIDKEGPPSAEKVGAGVRAGFKPAPTGPTDLQKGLYTVSYFAQMIESLTDVANSIDWEAAQEMDDSPLPGQFKEWLASGCEILKAMAAEEVDELLSDLSKAVGPVGAGLKPALTPAPTLAKAGARHSAADQEHIQAVHDHSVSLGADCAAEKVSTGETPVSPDLAKTIQAKEEELAKAAAEMETVKANLAKVTGENKALAAEVEKLKAEPAPAKGALKAVPKEADALNKATETEEPRTALEEIAAARQKPFLIR
jgi:regulator of replication initiation timing